MVNVLNATELYILKQECCATSASTVEKGRGVSGSHNTLFYLP